MGCVRKYKAVKEKMLLILISAFHWFYLFQEKLLSGINSRTKGLRFYRRNVLNLKISFFSHLKLAL